MTEARRGLGAAGESSVASWYQARGWTVLDRNWRCPQGELDLVVRKGRLHAFCEVKTRSTSAFGSPALAVGPAKQRRLRGLAMAWLQANGARPKGIRFDVAAVVGDEIEVIEGAF